MLSDVLSVINISRLQISHHQPISLSLKTGHLVTFVFTAIILLGVVVGEKARTGGAINMDIQTRKKLKSIVASMYVKMVGNNIPLPIIKDLDKIHRILWDKRENDNA